MVRCAAGALAMAAWLCVGAGSDSLEAIQAELGSANRVLKSFAAEYVGRQSLPGNRLHVATDLSGTMQWRRDGKRALFRIEQTGRSALELDGQTATNAMETVMVCDGEFVYTMNTLGDRKMAMKVTAGSGLAYDPAAVITAMHAFGEVSVLPEEQYDGATCAVLESVADEPKDGMTRQRYWFRKDIGLQVRMSGFDADGQEVMTTMIRKIQINPALPPDRFEFVPPPGVEVMDMTGSPGTP